MNQTERIKYTVTGFNFTEISKGKGSVEYQLMDDYGNERSGRQEWSSNSETST